MIASRKSLPRGLRGSALLVRGSVQDCINCLQQCTLIDLQQSPQLLRRSLLPSHARNFVLWASLKEDSPLQLRRQDQGSIVIASASHADLAGKLGVGAWPAGGLVPWPALRLSGQLSAIQEPSHTEGEEADGAACEDDACGGADTVAPRDAARRFQGHMQPEQLLMLLSVDQSCAELPAQLGAVAQMLRASGCRTPGGAAQPAGLLALLDESLCLDDCLTPLSLVRAPMAVDASWAADAAAAAAMPRSVAAEAAAAHCEAQAALASPGWVAEASPCQGNPEDPEAATAVAAAVAAEQQQQQKRLMEEWLNESICFSSGGAFQHWGRSVTPITPHMAMPTPAAPSPADISSGGGSGFGDGEAASTSKANAADAATGCGHGLSSPAVAGSSCSPVPSAAAATEAATPLVTASSGAPRSMEQLMLLMSLDQSISFFGDSNEAFASPAVPSRLPAPSAAASLAASAAFSQFAPQPECSSPMPLFAGSPFFRSGERELGSPSVLLSSPQLSALRGSDVFGSRTGSSGAASPAFTCDAGMRDGSSPVAGVFASPVVYDTPAMLGVQASAATGVLSNCAAGGTSPQDVAGPRRLWPAGEEDAAAGGAAGSEQAAADAPSVADSTGGMADAAAAPGEESSGQSSLQRSGAAEGAVPGVAACSPEPAVSGDDADSSDGDQQQLMHLLDFVQRHETPARTGLAGSAVCSPQSEPAWSPAPSALAAARHSAGQGDTELCTPAAVTPLQATADKQPDCDEVPPSPPASAMPQPQPQPSQQQHHQKEELSPQPLTPLLQRQLPSPQQQLTLQPLQQQETPQQRRPAAGGRHGIGQRASSNTLAQLLAGGAAQAAARRQEELRLSLTASTDSFCCLPGGGEGVFYSPAPPRTGAKQHGGQQKGGQQPMRASVAASMHQAYNTFALESMVEQVGLYEERVSELEEKLAQASGNAGQWRVASERLLSELQTLQQQLASSEAEGVTCLEAMAMLMEVVEEAGLPGSGASECAAADQPERCGGASSPDFSRQMEQPNAEACAVAAAEHSSPPLSVAKREQQERQRLAAAQAEAAAQVEALTWQLRAACQCEAAQQAANQQLEHALQEAAAREEQLCEQVDRLAAHNRELEQQYGAADAELQRTAAAAEGTAQQQQAALAEHGGAMAELVARAADAAAACQEAEQRAAASEASTQSLRAERDAATQKAEAARGAMQALQAQHEQRERQLLEQKAQLHDRQLERLQASCRQLESDNARLDGAESDLTSQYLEATARIQQLVAQLAEAGTAHAALAESNRQLVAQNASLSGMCSALGGQATSHPATQQPAGVDAAAAAAMQMPPPGVRPQHAAPLAGMRGMGDPAPTPRRVRLIQEHADLEQLCLALQQQVDEQAQQLERMGMAAEEPAPAPMPTILFQDEAADEAEDARKLAAALQEQLHEQQEAADAAAAEAAEQAQALRQDARAMQQHAEQLQAALQAAEADQQSLEMQAVASAGEAAELGRLLGAAQAELAATKAQLAALAERLQSAEAMAEGAPSTPCTPPSAATGAEQQRQPPAPHERPQSAGDASHAATAAAAQELLELRASNQRLQLEVSGLRCCCAELEAAAKLNSSSTQELSAALMQVCEQRETLQQQLQQAEHDHQRALQQAGTQVQRALWQQEEQVAALQRQVQQAPQDLQHALQQAEAQAQGALQQQQAEAAALEQQLHALRKELAASQQQVREQQAALQQAASMEHSEALELQECVHALQSKQAQLEQQLEEKRHHCLLLEQQLNATQLEGVALVEQLEASQGAQLQLEEQLLQLRSSQAAVLATAEAAVQAASQVDACAAATQTEAGAEAAGVVAARQPRRRWAIDQGVQAERSEADAAPALEMQLQQKEQQLHTAMHEQAAKSAECSQLFEQLSACRGQLLSTQEQLATSQEVAQGQQQALAHAEAKVADMSEDLAATRHALALAQQAQVAAAEQLQHSGDALTGSKQQLQELSAQLEARARELDARRQDLQHMQKQAQALQDALRQEQAASTEQQRQHKQQLNELAATLHTQQQQQQQQGLSEAQAVELLASLRAQLQQRQQQVEDLSASKAQLALELQQAQVAVDFLEASVRRLGKHNERLAHQLQEQLLLASTTSRPGTSWPSPSVGMQIGESGGDARTAAASAVGGSTARRQILGSNGSGEHAAVACRESLHPLNAHHSPQRQHQGMQSQLHSSCSCSSPQSGAMSDSGLLALAQLPAGAAGEALQLSPRAVKRLVAAASKVNDKYKRAQAQLQAEQLERQRLEARMKRDAVVARTSA